MTMENLVDQKKARLVQGFAQGMTVLEASKFAGVGTTTVYRWCEADPALKAEVDEAKCRADDTVEAVTYANCCDPDPAHNTLRMFWLKSRRPDPFRETIRQEVEATVKGYSVGNDPDDL